MTPNKHTIPLVILFLGGILISVFFTRIKMQQTTSYLSYDAQPQPTVLGAYNDSKPCPDGNFVELQTGVCRPLVHPEYGFDKATFNSEISSTVYEMPASDCSETAFLNYIGKVNATGGTLKLPACTIEVANGQVILGNNVLIQGAGKGQTIIKATAEIDRAFLIQNRKNVVLRDMTINGNGKKLQTVMVWYAKNILVENMEIYNTARTGVEIRYADRITVRYVSSHDHGGYHGVVIKDCMPDKSQPNEWATLSGCQAQFAEKSHTYGTLWTTSFLIYSTEVYNNNDHGFDIHGVDGEVAGNYTHDNVLASKFFDAQNVLVHHNKFSNAQRWDFHINRSINVPERIPSDIVLYQNTFTGYVGTMSGKSDLPVQIANPAYRITLAYNTYSTTKNSFSLSAGKSEIKICAGSQDASIASSSAYTLISDTSPECMQYKNGGTAGGTVTPTTTPTSTPTPIMTPTPTKVPTPSITPTATPTLTPTPTPTKVPTPSITPTPTATPTITMTPTPTKVPTPTPTMTPTPTNIPTPTITPTPTATPTPAVTSKTCISDPNKIFNPGYIQGELCNSQSGSFIRSLVAGSTNNYKISYIYPPVLLTYKVNSVNGGKYAIKVYTASDDDIDNRTSRNVSVRINGVKTLSAVQMPVTNSWDKFVPTTIGTVTLPKGVSNVTIVLGNWIDFDAFSITPQ